MTIARCTILLALRAYATPVQARPQAGNLPGSDPGGAPLDIAVQNRAAAALRARYQQNRAAYEAALRAHAAQAGDPAGYAHTLDAYRARIAEAPVASTPASPTKAAARTSCAAVTGRTYTGSLVTREPTRRRCTASAR